MYIRTYSDLSYINLGAHVPSLDFSPTYDYCDFAKTKNCSIFILRKFKFFTSIAFITRFTRSQCPVTLFTVYIWLLEKNTPPLEKKVLKHLQVIST